MMKQISRVHCALSQIENGRKYVRKNGKEICSAFQIDPDNQAAIDTLIGYFHGDPEFILPGGVHGNREKGILLLGAPGTGKSILMELFSKYVVFDQMHFFADGRNCPLTFPVVRTEHIVSEFTRYGFEAIEPYIRRRILCLDDLGEEVMEAFHFGVRINVIQHILEARYSISCITLATSNHRVEELSEMYGSRIGSRIPEMFNYLKLNGPDRRSPAYQQSLISKSES